MPNMMGIFSTLRRRINFNPCAWPIDSFLSESTYKSVRRRELGDDGSLAASNAICFAKTAIGLQLNSLNGEL
jgi:hypothetical protein